jgi:hypothetical protein
MRTLRTAAVTVSESLALFLVALFVAIFLPLSGHQTAFAADLTQRAIKTSNNVATRTGVIYELSMGYATSGPVGSVLVEFCSEGPLVGEPCSQPPGFDASAVALTAQTGATGFTVFSGSTANQIILTRPPAAVSAGTSATYTLSGIQNPSNDGTLYARVLTFASSDASGPYTDSGGLALAISPAPTIQAQVPPFLLFCLGESITAFDCSSATEPFSDVGTLGPLVTGAAQTQIVVATNGAGGYTMWVLGGTMTSGNNTIPAMAGGLSQKGVSQFGINLMANTAPIVGQDVVGPGVATISPGYDTQNQFRYQSGDSLVTAPTPADFNKFTVSYIVNVASGQPGGVYATTLTYIALANF